MKRSHDMAGGSSAPSGSASSGPSGSGQEGQNKKRKGLETPEKVREYRAGREQSQAMRNVHAWYAQEERRKAQLYQKRKDEEERKRRNEERQRIIEEASLTATRLAHEQTILLTNRFIDRMSQGASFEEARNQLGREIDERAEELRRSIHDSLNMSFPPAQADIVSSPHSSQPGSPILQPTPPTQSKVQDLAQSPDPVPLRSATPPPQAPQSPAPALPQSPAPALPQSPTPALPQSPTPAQPQSPAPAQPQPSAPAQPQPSAPAVPHRRRPGNPGRRSTRLAMLTEASSAFLKVGPYTDRLRTRPLMPRKYTA